MSEGYDRPMAMNVNVHAPQVVAVRAHRALGVGIMAIELGRRDVMLDTVRAELFVADDQLVDFVADLVDKADAVRPGFLLEVLQRLTV